MNKNNKFKIRNLVHLSCVTGVLVSQFGKAFGYLDENTSNIIFGVSIFSLMFTALFKVFSGDYRKKEKETAERSEID